MPESKVVKDSVKLMSGTMVARLAGLVRGLGVPFFLAEAAHYGLWQLVLVVWQYGMYLHLGSFEFLNRELPGLEIQYQKERRARLLSDGFWGTILVGLIAAICVAAWPVPAGENSFPGRRFIAFIAAIGVVMLQVVSFHILCFRSTSQFGRVSLVSVGMALLGLPLGLGGAWLWGIRGLVCGVVLSISVVACSGFFWNSFPALRFSLAGFWKQAKNGLPLSLVTSLIGILPTIGTVVSASMLGLEEAGYLGIAVLLGSLSVMLPQTIGTVMYPRFLKVVAAGRDKVVVSDMFRLLIKNVSILTPIVICCGAVVVTPVLQHLLPQYEQSIPLCFSLLGSSFFYSFTLVMMFPAKALHLHGALTRILVVGVAVAATSAIITVSLGGGILPMAIALMVANGLIGTATLVGGMIMAGGRGYNLAGSIGATYLPGIMMGALTFLLIKLPLDPGTTAGDFGMAGLRLVIFLAITTPFAWSNLKGLRR